jgi:hypothetical protein
MTKRKLSPVRTLKQARAYILQVGICGVLFSDQYLEVVQAGKL